MMALRKDPQRRYATVKELADDIRNYRADQPVRARGDGRAYRTGKFLRRRCATALARTEQAIALIEDAGLSEPDIYEWLGGLREASLTAP